MKHALALLSAILLLCTAASSDQNTLPAKNTAQTAEKPPGHSSDYAVLISRKTAAQKDWLAIADKLASHYKGPILYWNAGPEDAAKDLKHHAPRYLAVVARPEEINRPFIAKLHRITRELDDDPYGDCIWGLITGDSARTADKIADTSPEPLIIKRAMGTTNFDHNRFRHSFMITDWAPHEYWEQKNYGETDGKKQRENNRDGMAFLFAEKWQSLNPQLIVTSSHATQYNLEMPFSKGLIVSMNGRFHILRTDQLKQFARFLKGAVFDGSEEELKQYIKDTHAPLLPVSDEPKAWIAAGNCLFGDCNNSPNSMAVTAISVGGVRQLVGYTVPSWYGKGGWGTLSAFFDNTASIPLAQAWYLNNQAILEETFRRYPKAAAIQYNGSDLQSPSSENAQFSQSLAASGYPGEKDLLGLLYDRDVVAFYGNPKKTVTLDQTAPSKSPWNCTYLPGANNTPSEESIEITAAIDKKGPFSFWFPKRMDQNTPPLYLETDGKNIPVSEIGLETNDFVLIRELELKKGQKARLVRKR